MKLAEALARRAAIDAALSQLVLNWGCSIRESFPVKKPDVLLDQINELLVEKEELIKRINRTNCEKGNAGISPSQLIVKKDILALKISILRDLYNATGVNSSRYSNKEIKWVSTIDSQALQKQLDSLAQTLRETITTLQKYNWELELLS